MEKHKNIPAAATWDEKGYWQLGEKNEAGKEIGIWKGWRVEGQLYWTTAYGDGNPPFLYTGFHPDGTISQEGNWYGDNKWLGIYRWTKSDNPTTEPFPGGGGEKNPIIWMAEFDYKEEGIITAQRYYNKKKQRVSMDGELLPERPVTVPENAHYVSKNLASDGAAFWVVGPVDARIGKYIGDYAEYDLNGNTILKRVYNPETFSVVEQYTYENGKLFNSGLYKPDEKLFQTYHPDTDPPVVKESKLYRNKETDEQITQYDVEGNMLYSARLEEVNDQHKRRYYNGTLVFEGIRNADHAKAPSLVRYFYAGGAILIDYTSNGDGTGLWRLYDETGQELLTLPVLNETEANKKNSWEKFLPFFSSYKNDTSEADWTVVIDNFKTTHKRFVIREKIHALPVPEHLENELKKVDWTTIETAMTDGGKKLPVAINGLLAEEEELAIAGSNTIWYEIEHQGSIYEATYKVATIVARMLPFYTDKPTVQANGLSFLYEVLSQSGIDYHKKLFKELVTAFKPSIQFIIQRATDKDDAIAFQAQYLLCQTGKFIPEGENILKQEWLNPLHSDFRKAYAAFSLGDFYLNAKQEEKLIAEFSAAFPTETNKLLRLVLAIQLASATKKEALDPWLAELAEALTSPEAIEEDFDKLQPFIADFDVQEYVLMVLESAGKEKLEAHMDLLVEALPGAHALKQVTLFEVMFPILFPNRAALKKNTPVRKKALLAAAAVIDAHPGFLNHKEVFIECEIPYDSNKLRQLAAQ